MLNDISVILVGSVICDLNALISLNDNNFFPLAVEGSALKSPVRIVFLTFPMSDRSYTEVPPRKHDSRQGVYNMYTANICYYST